MGRKKVLEKRHKRLLAKKEELKKRGLASDDANEVRSINEQLEELENDIAETEEELEAIEEPVNGGNGAGDGPGVLPTGDESRGGNPIASYGNLGQTTGSGGKPEKRETLYSSMEYRKAFKDHLQQGTPIPKEYMVRAGGDTGTTVTTDIGAIIPETIMREFIKEVSKVYGNVYAKVRKLNIPGGVKFPISKMKASFKWINETTVSDKQKAGDIKEFITFDFNIGEIRVAQSLLSQVVALDLFESEIVRIMVEAYMEEMDKGIINGTGNGKLLGITKDPRITGNTSHIIEFTEKEFGDWKAWRQKLFSVVPLSKRGKGEFLFTASTVESYLLTMADVNNRPLFKEATDLNMGNTAGSFYGRVTDLVEPDIIADFATAAAGDIVGIFWVPGDYGINTNMQFGIKRYYDDDANEWINKGLTIVDGKMIDVSGCYLLKKKGTA